jgi:hypothetical protein
MSESIYTWIKPDPSVPEKPPLYHSKASPDAPLAGSTIISKKASHTGMGMTKKQMKETIKPENFLRAHQNTGWVNTDALREYPIWCPSCSPFALMQRRALSSHLQPNRTTRQLATFLQFHEGMSDLQSNQRNSRTLSP